MSNYPDDFNSQAFEAKWGNPTSEALEAERKETAQAGLVPHLRDAIEQYNKLHGISVSKEALDFATGYLDDMAGDLYHYVHNPLAIKPASEILLEAFEPRQITNPATQAIIGTDLTLNEGEAHAQ